MRGLKQKKSANDGWWWPVASFTDAWIETVNTSTGVLGFPGRIFYRCVDWNRYAIGLKEEAEESHLLQMRGLKQVDENGKRISFYVASFTDAWIETYFRSREQYLKTSHLLQMRGLKQRTNPFHTERARSRIFYRCVDWNYSCWWCWFAVWWSHLLQMRGLKLRLRRKVSLLPWSHLLQMRGLKRFIRLPLTIDAVASFTDAWIETETWSRTANLDAVASFTDAWIETERMCSYLSLW